MLYVLLAVLACLWCTLGASGAYVLAYLGCFWSLGWYSTILWVLLLFLKCLSTLGWYSGASDGIHILRVVFRCLGWVSGA